MVFKKLPKDLEQRLFDLTLALYRVTDFFPPGEALRKHLREKANEIFSQVLEYNYVEDLEDTILKILGKIQSVKGYLGIAKSLRAVKPVNLTVLEREYIFLANFFDKELASFNQADKSIVDTAINLEDKLDRENSIVTEPSLVITKLGSAVVENDRNKIAELIPSGKEEKVAEKEKENLSSWQDFSKGNPGSSSLRDEFHPTRLGQPLLLNERQEVILEHLKQTQQASSGAGRPGAKVSDFYSFFNNISSKTVQRDLQGLVAKNLLKKEGEKRWTFYTLKNFNIQTS